MKGEAISHLFCAEHMWDSLQESMPSQEHVDTVIACVQKEYDEGTLPFLSFEHFQELKELLPQFKAFFNDKSNLIVIGIGGSCLGIKALVQLLCPEQELCTRKKIYFAENVDARFMELLQTSLNPTHTAILAISKSGNTIETVSQYMLLKEWIQKESTDAWNTHCAVITDAKDGFLFQEADEHSLLCASIPHSMGGRYSVLSAVGVLPLLFLEKDCDALMEGAVHMAKHIMDTISITTNNTLWKIVFWQYTAELHGMAQTLLFSYIPRSMNLGLWFMQLWAESLGKDGRGTFPIFAQGAVDQHSLQQSFLDGKQQSTCIFLYANMSDSDTLHIKTENPQWEYINTKTLNDILSAEYQGTVESFINRNIPHIEYGIPEVSEYSIAGIFVFFQSIVFLLGRILAINPLNQPAVEYGKRITKEILQDGAPHDTVV